MSLPLPDWARLIGMPNAVAPCWGGDGRTALRVDGGMSASDFTMQFVADIIDVPVDRPTLLETTAKGAAWLAGYKDGIYPSPAGFAASWAQDRQFVPVMDSQDRDARYGRWKRAVTATMAF